MATVQKFEDLEIWQLARQLSSNIYSMYSDGPFARDFGLRDQINKAAGSVMDNIAEGYGRGGNKEFKNFLTYSVGSAAEVKSQLYRALDRGYITKEQFMEQYELADKIINKTGKFIGYLNKTDIKGMKFGFKTLFSVFF